MQEKQFRHEEKMKDKGIEEKRIELKLVQAKIQLQLLQMGELGKFSINFNMYTYMYIGVVI